MSRTQFVRKLFVWEHPSLHEDAPAGRPFKVVRNHLTDYDWWAYADNGDICIGVLTLEGHRIIETVLVRGMFAKAEEVFIAAEASDLSVPDEEAQDLPLPRREVADTTVFEKIKEIPVPQFEPVRVLEPVRALEPVRQTPESPVVADGRFATSRPMPLVHVPAGMKLVNADEIALSAAMPVDVDDTVIQNTGALLRSIDGGKHQLHPVESPDAQLRAA